MAVYMKYGSAQGDVTETGHKQWIEVVDFGWGMSRNLRSGVGIGKNRESTSAFVSEIAITKWIDDSSSSLTQSAFVGEAKPCTIEFTRVTQGQEAVFRKIELQQAIISSLTNSGKSTARPTEQLSLNFLVVAVTDIAMAPDGTATGSSTVTYDLQLAQTQ